MPAVTRKVVAIELPVKARKMNDRVTPFKAEYSRKRPEAVAGASLSTRADRKKTRPSSPNINP